MAPALSTTRDLRRTNRTAVLRQLLFEGPTTRPDLAARTRLSPATVGLVVNELLDQGLIEEGGTEESTGGRPRTIVQMRSGQGLAVGVDLGERGLRVEAFDLGWARRAERFLPLDARDVEPSSVVRLIEEGVAQVVRAADIPDARFLGVGVSVPGVVERTVDAAVHAPGLGWDGVPLGRYLRASATGPAVVENGAKAMGQAEMWFGAGRGVTDAVIALLGIGVGAAVFTEGRLYRGSSSSAGEWGHTPIVVDGDACRCGSRGCLEAYVGESAILRHWTERRPRVRARDRQVGPAATDTERLETLFRSIATDADAAAVAKDLARDLGAGLATLINLFDPQRIVLAGSVGLRLPEELMRLVRAAAGRYALRQAFESVEIVQGRLGHDAVALGAATLVVDDHLRHGFTMDRVDAIREMRGVA